MRMSTGSPEYKDRLFSFLFGNEAHKEWTLSLYNAINGTHYDNPDDISIETIRQVLYPTGLLSTSVVRLPEKSNMCSSLM